MTSVNDEREMMALGVKLGSLLRGGEVFELIGDVGAGKTTLVKGIGQGLRIDEDVQSPSFTISRVYPARDGLELHHYDFYRLSDAGVMAYELAESLETDGAVSVIEWAETVGAVLPEERVQVLIKYLPHSEGREVMIALPERYKYLEGVA